MLILFFTKHGKAYNTMLSQTLILTPIPMLQYLRVVHHAAAGIVVAAIPRAVALLAGVIGVLSGGGGCLERPQLGGQPRGLLLGAQLLLLRVGRPLLRVLRDRRETLIYTSVPWRCDSGK